MASRKRRLWRSVQFGAVGLLGALTVGLGTAAEQPDKPTPPPAQTRSISQGKAAVTGNPMDEPVALTHRARAAYAKVRDYSCILIKRERLAGKLTPNHVIVMKMRTDPFSVNLRWQEPKALAGQECCYVAGKNKGEMRVKPAGLLGAIGFVSLGANDARAKETSNHPITDAGIGWLIEQCANGWEMERNLGHKHVHVGSYQYAKRRCTRVELTHPTRDNPKILFHRNVVYFDQQLHLPIRVENYDWPKTPGQPGELVEVYSYVNLRLNVNIPDSAFNR